MAAPERAAARTARPAVGARGARRGARAARAVHCPSGSTLLVVAAGAWRWAADRRRWPLPPRWLRVLAVLAATLAVLGTYRTLNGIEAGTAFLVLMAAREAARDARRARPHGAGVHRLFPAVRGAAARPAPAAAALSARRGAVRDGRADARARGRRRRFRPRRAAPHAARCCCRPLPLALLLFLLFPRLPGPFWGIAAGESARTGLGDEMTPGDISDLSVSGEVAFRVRFFGDDPAAARSATGAARCCTSSTGAAGAGRRAQAFPDQARRSSSASRSTTRSRWSRTDRAAGSWRSTCPAEWPEREAYRSYDFQLRRAAPPHRGVVVPPALLPALRRRARSCRSRCAARTCSCRRRAIRAVARSAAATRRRGTGDPLAIARALLTMFREQPFVYTLRPAEARRQRDGRVPVRDATRLLRALRVGLHPGDARARACRRASSPATRAASSTRSAAT